ncbi:MAG TPA: class II aldolase/adducin family protein [Candidatus Paceibacterota bacterium]|nr:class II aldolase/adducin family protein [Verrucomicrobiota bacterium]HSA10701.1 class II aldolase/adducin family protein [Candidatus Paceibacterota bacterium]
MPTPITQDLLTLSREIGREDRGLAILGEGNTSARVGDDTFAVKASGTCLGTLKTEDVVECRLAALLPLLDKESLTDQQIEDALMAARVDQKAKKPSVEAVFHAWLLSLPGIKFVGHGHPTAALQILCSPRARDFAEHRMFPDEIVCCNIASVLVPYTDPGLKLAQAIRRQTEAFIKKHQRQPRVILMQNHGVITLGASWQSVLAAMLIAEKAAKVFAGAAAMGGPVFFTEQHVQRIAGRPDEAYRQRALKM